MALVNKTTGEYLKVLSMQFDFQQGNHHVTYNLFANKDQRDRFESGLSEYENYKSNIQYNGIGHIEKALSLIADSKPIKDNMFLACYTALKNDMYADWEDC